MLASKHSFNKGAGEVVVGVSALGARVGELLDWMAEGFYTIVKESTRDRVWPETLIGNWNYDKHWTVRWGGRLVSPEDREWMNNRKRRLEAYSIPENSTHLNLTFLPTA